MIYDLIFFYYYFIHENINSDVWCGVTNRIHGSYAIYNISFAILCSIFRMTICFTHYHSWLAADANSWPCATARKSNDYGDKMTCIYDVNIQ